MSNIGCDKCPYSTGDTCCHQSIRTKTEVTGDDRAIKREFMRIEKVASTKAGKHRIQNKKKPHRWQAIGLRCFLKIKTTEVSNHE